MSTRATTARTASPDRPAPVVGAFVVAGLVAWLAFAFGGIYPRTLGVPALACAALLALYRPRILAGGPAPELDRRLLVVLGAAALQLVPLPQGLVALLSPAAGEAARAIRLVEPSGPLPLTIGARDTAAAVATYAAMLAVYFSARQVFASGGVRVVTRLVALTGLALAAIALAQHFTEPRLMYWKWRPIDEAPFPFGPFVNRNHFGTWAVLAAPLCAGYLMAHVTAHRGPRPTMPWQKRLKAAMDVRGAFLLIACALLILATVVSLSRSSMSGLVAAAAALAYMGRTKAAEGAAPPRRALVVVGALAGMSGAAVLFFVGASAVVARFAATHVATVDRLLIWRDALGVVRDFWLTGSGAGTFQLSMALYQRTSPGVIYNQAHNQYLQVISEGGLLVALPAALALAAFVRQARASLAADRSGMFWIRAGAAAGLAGVALQNVWETGLTTPANAALAAVAAAVVTHAPVRSWASRAH